jgi:hypothetical protein
MIKANAFYSLLVSVFSMYYIKGFQLQNPKHGVTSLKTP